MSPLEILKKRRLQEAPSASSVPKPTKKSESKVATSSDDTRSSKRPKKAVNYNEEVQISANVTEIHIPKAIEAEVYKKSSPAPPTRNTQTGELSFSDHPEFRPNLTPKEVSIA